MSNEVYANSMEVACKAAAGKTICAMPDVCFTPPENPATPPGVPVPYPNTGFASDTTEGSKTVKISGKEIMLKGVSYFKKSTGDEAGCAAKKGIITSKNTGKVYFQSWSMDVKAEGENLDRHLDMTTNNHASAPGDTPPWVYMDAGALASASQKCQDESNKTQKCMEKHVKSNTHQEKRKNHAKPGATKVSTLKKDSSKPDPAADANVDWNALIESDKGEGAFYNKKGTTEDMCGDPECKDQFDCNLVPFDFGCCGDKTPHHVVPAHCFLPSGERKSGAGDRYPGTDAYNDTKAPCICLEGGTKSEKIPGTDKVKEHGQVHAIVDDLEDGFMEDVPQFTPKRKPKMSGGEQVIKKTAGTWNFEQANEAGCHAAAKVKGCDKECMKAQSEAAHKHMGLDVGKGRSDKLQLRADSAGNRTPEGFVPSGTVSGPIAG